MVAVVVWGNSWSKTLVQFRSDNMAVVEILRRCSTRNPLTHHLHRCFYFYSALFQFDYCIAHILGVVNVAADALSYNNLLLCCSFVPQASRVQVTTSDVLLLTQHPDWGLPQWTALFDNMQQTLWPQPHMPPTLWPQTVTFTSAHDSN